MFRIVPTKAAQRNIERILQSPVLFHKGLRSALFDIGKDFSIDAAKRINNEGRSGNVYFFRGLTHVASAPGESPANLTGLLKRSYNYSVRGVEEVEIGNSAPYAGYLENGTQKIKPRPNLQKVADERGQHHAGYLQQRVDDALKGRS